MGNWRSFLALRADVGVILVVSWNLLRCLGLYLNGGSGTIREPRSAAAAAVACGLVSLFFLTAVLNERFRNLVTAESRRHRYSTPTWAFMAALSGFLCLASLAVWAGWLPSADLRQ